MERSKRPPREGGDQRHKALIAPEGQEVEAEDLSIQTMVSQFGSKSLVEEKKLEGASQALALFSEARLSEVS